MKFFLGLGVSYAELKTSTDIRGLLYIPGPKSTHCSKPFMLAQTHDATNLRQDEKKVLDKLRENPTAVSRSCSFRNTMRLI